MANVTKIIGKKLNKLNEKDIKCVFLGDSGVGKTKLICSYVYNKPKVDIGSLTKCQHMPSIFAFDSNSSSKRVKVSIGKQLASLRIWDTFGDHEKDREYSYRNADVVVICYNIGSRVSFNNVYDQWYKEIQTYCPKVPIILVGTQMDRRHNDSSLYICNNASRIYSLQQYLNHVTHPIPINTNESSSSIIESAIGRVMARKLGAHLYMETSVATKYGVNLLFRNAIKIGLAYRLNKLYKFINSVETVVQKPYLPPHPNFPTLTIPGLSVTDCKEISKNYTDVIFDFDGQKVYCHSIILAMSSELFEYIFKVILNDNDASLPQIENFEFFESMVQGRNIYLPKGFDHITIGTDKQICFHMTPCDIESFKKIIYFYYNGYIISEDLIDEFDCMKVKLTAERLQLMTEFKMNYCFYTKDSFQMRESIYKNEALIHRNSDKFVNNQLLADCSIKIGDKVLHAHKFILSMSCKVLHAMFANEMFKESQSSQVNQQCCFSVFY